MNLFQFKPVGQGLFYTGTINNEFNFIYDCGTSNEMSIIESEIENMKFLGNTQKFNFIVISHLHADHFNALPLLLKKYKTDKVYLPYLGENKTLIQFILAKEIFGQRNHDKNLLLLYSYMCRLYGVEVMSDDFRYELEYIPHVEYLGELTEDNINNTGGNHSNNPKLDIINTYKNREAHYLWDFIFINRILSTNRMSYATKIINGYFENLIGKDFTLEQAHRAIVQKVQTYRGLSEIESIYGEAFGKNQNITSTILIHYPKLNCSKIQICNYHDSYLYPYLIVPYGEIYEIGGDINKLTGSITLLTGDAEFNRDMCKAVNSILKYRKYGLLQVPHHGGYSNWEKLKNIPQQFKAFVIPVGKNGYDHPNNEVIHELNKMKGKSVFFATECNGCIYWIN